VVGSCEHGNRPFGSINDEEFSSRLAERAVNYSIRTLLHVVGFNLSETNFAVDINVPSITKYYSYN
jgi:hypothetical protein